MSSTTIFKVRPATCDAKTSPNRHITALFEIGFLADPRLLTFPLRESAEAFWREAIEYAEPEAAGRLQMTRRSSALSVLTAPAMRVRRPPSRVRSGPFDVAPGYWGKGAGVALWHAAGEGLQDEGCTMATVWLPLRMTSRHALPRVGWLRTGNEYRQDRGHWCGEGRRDSSEAQFGVIAQVLDALPRYRWNSPLQTSKSFRYPRPQSPALAAVEGNDGACRGGVGKLVPVSPEPLQHWHRGPIVCG